ncbi:MAG: hypothetical protein AAF436_11715 [Myxococcota bacterium]
MRRFFVFDLAFGLVIGLGATFGCEKPEAAPESIEVAAEHRSCAEGEACAVVETSCVSVGCECGVAVNESALIGYQQALAECRGQQALETCDSTCETPFAKCFNGACVLTKEPPPMVRRGKDIKKLCEESGGTYAGCPDCPPNARCKSCTPCECRSRDRWTRSGCRRSVKTEPRDIRVEIRPREAVLTRPVKARVHNDSRRTVWLKSVCGTPFYQARRKEDQWDVQYQRVPDGRCKTRAIEIDPGKNRPFVVNTLSQLAAPSGSLAEPGTYRFELTFTDGDADFRYYDTVYSAEFDAVSKRRRR